MGCWRQVIAVLIIALSITIISACRSEIVPQTTSTAPTPTLIGSIPFRVITQGAPLGDQPKEPRYSVAITSQDWDALQPIIPEAAYKAGKALDPSTGELILVLYLGVRGTSGYSIEIVEISSIKEQCTIKFKEVKPSTDSITEPAHTLPFILVALPMSAFPQQGGISFVFKEVIIGETSQQDVLLP